MNLFDVCILEVVFFDDFAGNFVLDKFFAVGLGQGEPLLAIGEA